MVTFEKTRMSHCIVCLHEEVVFFSFNATPRGSQWYHSHTGLQRSNGLFGAFVVLNLVNRTDRELFLNFLGYEKLLADFLGYEKQYFTLICN